MHAIRVEAASAVPWADVEHSLTGGGDDGSCWCQWFTIPCKDFNASTLDDPDVWAITCFVVRRQFRGLGVAKRLVGAGVEHAASHGARLVEAYPIDTDQRSRRVNDLYVGTVSLFGGQGFVETARPIGARVVMTRDLSVAS